jgi:hypothetical protein
MHVGQGDREWLVVTLHEDPSAQEGDANEAWRRMREKLEAVSVLSAVACTEHCAWYRNESFWRRFTQLPDRKARPQRSVDSLAVPRDDMAMPRFKLDFSFAAITADVVSLLSHVLMGSEKAMRHSFKLAMAALATVPTYTRRAATVPIALRFARCQWSGKDIVKNLVAVIETVNHARQRRHREVSNATSRAMYFQIVELDLSNARLSESDLDHLRRLPVAVGGAGFRLVLDNTITASTDGMLPFGSLVSSWFDPQSPTITEKESASEQSMHASVSGVTSVSLHGSALSAYHVASLFSAIQSTGRRGSASQEILLRRAFQCCDPTVVWAWVAFAVWSRGTCSRLTSLDVSGNVLRLEDAAVVRHVMAASDGAGTARLLYRLTSELPTARPSHHQVKRSSKQRRRSQRGGNASESSERLQDDPCSPPSWICLQVGTKLKLATAGKTVQLVLTSPMVVCVVDMRSAHDAVVLLPGYGFLQVDATTAPAEVRETEESLHDRHHYLQELKLNSMVVPDDTQQPDAVFDALFSTLSLPALTTLELNRNPLGQNTLRVIILACPSLRSLSLEDCELQSIRAIIDAYAAGVCLLESLDLTDNAIGDRDVIDLCRLITRGAASHLQVLRLHQNPITHRGIHALSVAVRESPHALVELVLDKAQDPDAHFRAVFYPLHGQFLGVASLSDAHRREFHDALARRLQTTALEPSIVDRIYAYAAVALHRRIVWM